MGMTDENKSVEQSYFYDEFGDSLGSWGGVSNNYLYTGQEYDGSITQLYNLRARYYKPSIARFISEDPVVHVPSSCCLLFVDPSVSGVKLASHFQPQNLNAYSYCANSPVNEKDILGMVSWDAGCTIVASCYLRSCKEIRDPSHPCKKLTSDRKCEEIVSSWFRTCMGGKATETPPAELPFNDICHELYKLFFVPIGPYSPYGVYE
jgi:RHS repeat-associated protein